MSLIHSSKWLVHAVTSNDLHTTPIFIVLPCLKLGCSNLRKMSCKSQMEMWCCWGQQQVSWVSSSGLLQRWVSSGTHVVRVLHAIQKLETGENKQHVILPRVDIRRTRCTLYVWSCWKLCELKTTVWGNPPLANLKSCLHSPFTVWCGGEIPCWIWGSRTDFFCPAQFPLSWNCNSGWWWYRWWPWCSGPQLKLLLTQQVQKVHCKDLA